MATWQAIVNGTTYNLSNASPFKVLSVTGVGNAPVRRLEERGPFQDGVTDVGYRFDARLMTLVIGVHSASQSAADTNRDTLSLIFNPAGGRMVQLRCTRDDGAVRQIDCYAVGMVDMPAELGERMLAWQRVGVQLKAPNPMWYDPTIQGVTFVAAGTATATSEWWTGGGLIPGTSVLTYAGTPSIGQVGTIGTPSYWTILARTANPSSGTQTLWSIPGVNTYFRQGTATTNGTIALNGGYQTGADFPAAAGTSAHWFVHSGTAPNVYYVYYGTAITLGWAPGPDKALEGNTIRWRDRGAGVEQWAGTVTHAAVWSGGLTQVQRDAVESVIATGAVSSGVFMGTATVNGSWEEYPVITLTGPMANPVVSNLATGEVLDFTGATISASEVYQIDTRYGYKTVLTQAGSSVINKLTDDSDLATFHLVRGSNFIQVSATGTASTSAVGLAYYNRYIGL